MEQWLRSNILTIITAVVAVYGAVLATLNYRNARREKTRSLKVRLTNGFLTFGAGMGSELSHLHFIVEVSNPGHSTVTLRSVVITVAGLSVHMLGESSEARRLPFDVTPGQGLNFWIECRGVAEDLAERAIRGKAKLQAVARDATNQEYRSRKVTFDLDGLRRE